MASPICLINGSSQIGGVNVSAGSTVTVSLQSSSGVSSWTLSCISSDNLVNQPIAAVNATLAVNQLTKTATFTAPDGYCGLIFKSTINNGIDVNGSPQPSYSTTFGVFVLCGNGQRVIPVGSTTEMSATDGWLDAINYGIVNDTGTSGNAGLGTYYNSGSINVGQNADNTILVNTHDIQLNPAKYSTSATANTLAERDSNGALTLSSTSSGTTSLYGGTSIAFGGNFTIGGISGNLTLAPSGSLFLNPGTGVTLNSSLTMNGTIPINAGGNIVLTGTGSQVQFSPGDATAAILFQTQTSNVPTNTLTISGQAPYASATGTSRIPGYIILSLAAPSNSGTVRGEIVMEDAGNTFMTFSADSLGNGILFLGGTGIVRSGSSLSIQPSSLGFYTATPVSQAARAGQITDSTGGTASTTFASITAGSSYAQADMVAVKNALASIAAQYNKIELYCHNLGISA